MYLQLLESNRHWRVTAEYHGSRGQQIAYLMDDGLIGGQHYWLITDGPDQWPTMHRDCNPRTTARMIEAGKLRLIHGCWPNVVLNVLAAAPDSVSPDPMSGGSLNGALDVKEVRLTGGVMPARPAPNQAETPVVPDRR